MLHAPTDPYPDCPAWRPGVIDRACDQVAGPVSPTGTGATAASRATLDGGPQPRVVASALGVLAGLTLLGLGLPPPAYLAICLAELLVAVLFALLRPMSRYAGVASAWGVALTLPVAHTVCADALPGLSAALASTASVALAAAMSARGPWWSDAAATVRSVRRPWWLAWILGAVAASSLLALIGAAAGARAAELPGELPGPARPILTVAAMVHGVGAEVIVRGLLVSALIRLLQSRGLAVTAGAALSAAVALDPGASLQSLALLVALGLLMGWFMVRSRSLIGPVAGHVAFVLTAAFL